MLYAGIALLLAHLGFSICGSADNVTLRTLFVEPFITGHQYGLNLAGWFVAPLFLSQMWALLTRMAYHGRRSNHVWFAVGLLMGVCSVLLSNGGMHKGGWLTLVHFLYFVMFYEAGNYYRTMLERHDTLSNDTYFALLFCFWMFLLIARGAIPWSNPAFGNFTHNALLVSVVAFSGIAFWLRVAKVLEPSMGRSRIVNLVADSTFSTMINHLLGFFLLNLVFYTVSQHTGLLHGFDTVEWHNNIWYTYLPRGLWRTHLLYVVAGIAFGVGIQQVLNFAKRRIGARKA
ncbi:MAG: hypothetical protein IJ680_01795 [Paludibacteraceae bacterium]|nr:hypothetical protein [Paludibacteraceae bacterium]